MDYIEFKWWKAGVLIALAFVYGLWRGFTGRSKRERRETPPD